MGQLRTRKRGNKWEYSFEGASVAGKRKTISKSGFRTKFDALTAETQAMNEYNNSGQTFSPAVISISDYLYPLMIGYYTGLRISETFGLTWNDIDFDNRTISVDKAIVKRNYGVDARKVIEQKGKKEEKSAWYFGTP
jgi:integrase